MVLGRRPGIVFETPVRTPLGSVGISGLYENSQWDFDGLRTIYYYSLTYVLEGRCHYTDPTGRDAIFEAGDLFFCFPGMPHRFDPVEGEHFSEFWIAFGGPFFDTWREAKFLDPDRFTLHLKPVDYWLGRFEALFNNIRNDEFGQVMLMASLQGLIAEAMSIQKAVNDADEEWVTRAKAALDAVRTADVDLSNVATDLNMSYSTFRQKFVALSGVSPRRYHIGRLMQLVCVLLYQSNFSNKEIAERFGFCDQHHFSKRFKQIIGMSPREFRAKLHLGQPLAFRNSEWTSFIPEGQGLLADDD